jgi:hypothetical protein
MFEFPDGAGSSEAVWLRSVGFVGRNLSPGRANLLDHAHRGQDGRGLSGRKDIND